MPTNDSTQLTPLARGLGLTSVIAVFAIPVVAVWQWAAEGLTFRYVVAYVVTWVFDVILASFLSAAAQPDSRR